MGQAEELICFTTGTIQNFLARPPACTLVLTIGEVYLSPIGLSLVTKIAPARIVSMMMGVWFLSSFFGNSWSGYLGTFWEKMPKEHLFLLMFTLSFATSLAFFALLTPLKKAIE